MTLTRDLQVKLPLSTVAKPPITSKIDLLHTGEIFFSTLKKVKLLMRLNISFITDRVLLL